MSRTWKYCSVCGSECLEFESGNVICPLCKKRLEPSDYDIDENRRKPKRGW